MRKTKNTWLWNSIIVFTLIFCALAFALHYKNWATTENGEFKISSGIYAESVSFSEIDSITWVKKLPEMERKHGFSWLTREKGVFNDSLSMGKVYVFVDDLQQRKIRLVYQDSLQMYVNFRDSTVTRQFYEQLMRAINFN
ncbi:MAG: hypothetical protein AAGB24_10240 [Bacteroidota bacterium]